MIDAGTRIKREDWTPEEIADVTGELPFRSLWEAWIWHILIGSNVIFREALSLKKFYSLEDGKLLTEVERIENFLRRRLAEQRNGRKTSRLEPSLARGMRNKLPLDSSRPRLDQIATMKRHPVWLDILFAMAKWADGEGLLDSGTGCNIGPSTPLNSVVKGRIAELAPSNEGAQKLREFLLLIMREFPWSSKEWQFDDPLTVYQRDLAVCRTWNEVNLESVFECGA